MEWEQMRKGEKVREREGARVREWDKSKRL